MRRECEVIPGRIATTRFMQRRLCPSSFSPSLSPSASCAQLRSDPRYAVRAAWRRHGRRAAAPRRRPPPAPHSPAPSPSAAPAQATRQAPLLLPRGCQRCAHHEECCKRGDSELHIAVLCRDLRRQPLHARRACWRLAQAQPPAAVVLRDEAVVMDVEGQRRPADVPAACPAPAPLALSDQPGSDSELCTSSRFRNSLRRASCCCWEDASLDMRPIY